MRHADPICNPASADADDLSRATDNWLSPSDLRLSRQLRFVLAKDGQAELTLYGITGRLVATLARGTYEAGEHRLAWVAGTVPAGVYFLQLRTNGETMVRKVVVSP